MNYYPPYLGAGIKVKHVNDSVTRFEVVMRLRWYNRNLFGTHFGGSLYSMTDPFFVFILVANLGQNYIVWDKTATIKFLKPGKTDVKAIFEMTEEKIAQIKEEVDQLGKKTYLLSVDILSTSGEIVAQVEKEVYVRRKKDKK